MSYSLAGSLVVWGDADVGDLVWDIGGGGINRFGVEASSFPPPVRWESYVG